MNVPDNRTFPNVAQPQAAPYWYARPGTQPTDATQGFGREFAPVGTSATTKNWFLGRVSNNLACTAQLLIPQKLPGRPVHHADWVVPFATKTKGY